MHHYTFNVSKQTEKEYLAYPFSFEAKVLLPADKVWDEWILTLTDTEKSWFWPLQYSQPRVESMPMAAGGLLILDYEIPNPHDGNRPPKIAQYQFHIVECDHEKRFYKYQATDDHPFLVGGGMVSVEANNTKSSNLVWKGKYKHLRENKNALAQGDVFAHFLCSFFTALAQNINNNIGYD
jgi:hypothetical protein